MIVAWMLSVLLFSICVAVAAAAADSLARALGRPTRWIWGAALATTALWPILASLTVLAVPAVGRAPSVLPAVRVLPHEVSLMTLASAETIELAGRILLGVWMLLSVLLILRLGRALRMVGRVRATSESRLLDGVPILLTDTLGPATIGLRRHTVVVPRALLELEEPLRRLVLRHELEHCAARDPVLLLASGVAVVLFPWNAALWFIARRLHLALEIDCDARVLAAGAEPARYGRLLVLLAQRHGAIPLAPMLAAPLSHLERRIIAMRTRLARPRPLRLALGAGLAVLGVAGACSQGGLDAPLARKVATEPSGAPAPSVMLGPYLENQVETPVRQIPVAGLLRYPDAMRRANREGAVLTQFVVDAKGVPDMTTFEALKSSDAAFTDAVRAALTSMRFTPALIGGKPVPQLVQLPFTFELASTGPAPHAPAD